MVILPWSIAITSKLQDGMLKDKVWISDDFDAPLPPEILKSFGIDP